MSSLLYNSFFIDISFWFIGVLSLLYLYLSVINFKYSSLLYKLYIRLLSKLVFKTEIVFSEVFVYNKSIFW